jgi:hypothetical protein
MHLMSCSPTQLALAFARVSCSMPRCRSSSRISSNSLCKVLHFVSSKLGAFIPPTGCAVIQVLVGGYLSD